MFTRELQVRFGECDGLGHVNNGSYFTYMEDARIDIFRLFNPTLDLEEWNLIVASTRCDFLLQVRYAEKLWVDSWVSKVGNSSFTVEHAIRNETGDWVARGQAALIAYDYQMKKATPLATDIREQLLSHVEGPTNAPAIRA